MSDSKLNFDIIKLIKEVSKQGIKNFEFEYGDLKIKLSGGVVEAAPNVQERVIPEASKRQLEELEEQEEKTIAERIKERDESLLDDIDFLPELAGDLRRANIIKLGEGGVYEYVEQEGINA